jgi:hypothetical protein
LLLLWYFLVERKQFKGPAWLEEKAASADKELV